MTAESSADVPRDLKQIYNVRASLKNQENLDRGIPVESSKYKFHSALIMAVQEQGTDGKLHAIFAHAGRGVEWHCLLGVGNPAADRSVKSYLASVREEQLRAHVTPCQAEPVLVSDLEVVSRYIQIELSEKCTDPLQAYILARDHVVSKALFFSGDRAADLLGLLTHTILRFPDNSGLLFNQVWTKTLHAGDSNVFALKRGSNQLICPGSGLEMFSCLQGH